MRILIIEDHYYFVQKLLAAISEEDTAGEDNQLLITTTGDAQMGMKLLEQKWNVILIDHDLPNRWSGWQLLNNTMYFRHEDNAKIIAISCVPDNNTRLLQHGAQFAVDKMDKEFIPKVYKLIFNKDYSPNDGVVPIDAVSDTTLKR
jgi:DNA-binding NarL/FixJ family response regulator